MNIRHAELSALKKYTETVDKELTLILQSLQWDRNSLLQKPALHTCKYDSNHRMPSAHSARHEQQCFLKHYGYRDEDLLPDPLDPTSSTLVKLTKEDVTNILASASKTDASWKRGSNGPEPLSLERLQCVYSGDERRAIHDAVVSAVPSCHDLADLALTSSTEPGNDQVRAPSRAEVLAELRNMRRRRAKYRVAAKSRNYSDVLRDVIKTQMEHYNEATTAPPVESTTHNTNEKQADGNRDRRYKNNTEQGKDETGGMRERKETYDKREQYREKSHRDYDSYSRDRQERNKLDRDYGRKDGHEGQRDRDTRYYNKDRRNEGHNERDIKVEKDAYDRSDHRNSKDSDKYREYSRKRRHDNHNRDEKGHHTRDIRIKQELTSDHEEDHGHEKRKYHNKRSHNDSHRHSKEARYDKNVERYSKDRKEGKYERRSNTREYSNIRVKSERVSRERSYESYTAEDTYGDKYSRYPPKK